MKRPDEKAADKLVQETYKVHDEAREALYLVRNIKAHLEEFASYFDKEEVCWALSYIAARKTATLDEIQDYFDFDQEERLTIEKAIDFGPLNFIHTYRDGKEGVLFKWDCPRLWMEYKAGREWFTREMLDDEINAVIEKVHKDAGIISVSYKNYGDYQQAECPICGQMNVNAVESDLCEHFHEMNGTTMNFKENH